MEAPKAERKIKKSERFNGIGKSKTLAQKEK
jgi:hypothetical protein